MNCIAKTTRLTLNWSKPSFLLAVLAISMFATIMPASVNSITNPVTVSAVEKLAKSLTQAVAEAGDSVVNVVIEVVESASVAGLVEEVGGEVATIYESVEAFAASVPASRLVDLASNPNVRRIYADDLRFLHYQGAITEETLRASIPLDPLTNVPVIETEMSEYQVESIPIENLESVDPTIYLNPNLTHAWEVWGETAAGDGATVAIIDTGVWSASPLLTGNVIGGIDLSPDNGTAYEGYNATWNHYHGTACAHLLAAHAYIIFGAAHPWAQAILKYDPEGTWYDGTYIWVTCLGIAPAASIYGIKVFPSTGAGVPASIIMEGIDHAIQKKLSGAIDIDVISMSLGGGVGADGEDPEDLLVDAATEAGITVVAAAGNEGPAPLRVGSPGSAKTAIAVGAAMDPIHERVFGEIAYGLGDFYYPHDEMSIVYFSSRGPSADGRIKPEVVATGSWCFLGLFADGYVRLGGGTSYSCPQVSGAAALLTAYIEQNLLAYGPAEVKQAIYDGAEPIPGFTEMEQGAGYINIAASLEVMKSGCFGTIPETWPHHAANLWFPPIDTLHVKSGEASITDVTLEPGKYQYYAISVNRQVDSIKIKLSGVQLADPALQNPVFGDGSWIYLSTSERGGLDEYHFGPLFFWGDGEILVSSNVDFQPGLVRLVFEGDFSSYEATYIEEVTIEVVETWGISIGQRVLLYNRGVQTEAQVEVYEGSIQRYYGWVDEGGSDVYYFSIPDSTGFAYLVLSWCRDWNHWATSDLDLYAINPDGSLNWEGATAASPEATVISGPGDYILIVEGYQVYFDKVELYCLEIIYFADSVPLWSSPIFNLHGISLIKSPVLGLAEVWLHDTDFDHWYIGEFLQLRKLGRRGSGCGAYSGYMA